MCDVTKRQTNEGSSIIYITEKLAHQHAQNMTFGLFATASFFRLTSWFHWIALTENSQMSTHLPGFQSFSGLHFPPFNTK